MGNDTGFTTTSAGEYQAGLVYAGDRLLLGRVEVLQVHDRYFMVRSSFNILAKFINTHPSLTIA